MLATLLLTCLSCLPQEPVGASGTAAAAVAVRGDAELSPAAAFSSAQAKV